MMGPNANRRLHAIRVLGMALVTLALTAGLFGCNTGTTTPPTTPPKQPSKPETIGELADLGTTVYANRCARCHGATGQGVVGPALIGPNSSLTKFQTADGIYEYVSLAMPMDAPGTMSKDEYMQVVGYLLIKNDLTAKDTRYNGEGLKAIRLLP